MMCMMKTCWGIWTLTAVAALAQNPILFCAQVDVLADPSKPPATGSISARTVLDLTFDVNLSGDVAGEHILELKLRTPKGHEYQTLTVPVTTEGGRQSAERRVATYPRPLPVQVLEAGQGRDSQSFRARLNLPVAGTSIVNNGLYGHWSIDVYLDGQLMSCDQLNGFHLVP